MISKSLEIKLVFNSVLAFCCVLLLSANFLLSVHNYSNARSVNILSLSTAKSPELNYLIDELLTEVGDVRRGTIIVYTTNHKTNNVELTAVVDQHAEDRNSIIPSYSNVPLSGDVSYLRNFIQGKCSYIGTDDLGIVTKTKKELGVFAISVPIHNPDLIGEVGIAFDEGYPMTKTFEEYCEILRPYAIQIAKSLRNSQ